jgi:hypothetical protein
MAGAINAQVIFSGVSPAAIQGNYSMEYGEPGSGWGSPDLMLPVNSVEDTLVQYLTDTIACTAATNTADLAGQIAILFRGDCEFGTKVMNAEAAGAIACVIINNAPGGPVPMAAGTDGAGVTIPVVMIGDVDGEILINEMANGVVTVFLGNKALYYNDDFGLTERQILRPRFASMPSALATDGSEYDVELAGKIYNYGVNDQTGVTLQAIITLNGTEVYNETSAPLAISSGDSTDVTTLPTFSPAMWAEGYYSLQYITTSDASDEYPFDNELESDFVISASDLAYASIDETTLKQNSSGGVRPVDGSGNAIPYFSSCITFRDANASRLAPSAISFTAIKGNDAVDPSLEGEEFLVQVFEYNDVFTDVEDGGYVNPIGSYNDIVVQTYAFPSDLSDTVVTVTFDNDNIVALEDNQRYMFCATTFNEEVFLGTDSKRDYRRNIEYYKQPMFPVEGGSGSFNPNGFGAESVSSVSVSFIDAALVNLKDEKTAINMNAYPSPASDVLNVDFNKNEVSKVELVNMMGQTVVAQNVTNNAETATMNVASVENGVYIVKVYLTNNMTHTMQVVVNH